MAAEAVYRRNSFNGGTKQTKSGLMLDVRLASLSAIREGRKPSRKRAWFRGRDANGPRGPQRSQTAWAESSERRSVLKKITAPECVVKGQSSVWLCGHDRLVEPNVMPFGRRDVAERLEQPPERALQEKFCSLSCSSRLHFLRYRSLPQTKRGSGL